MHITQFQNIIQQDKPIIVEFWAPWCAPCKQMAPILENVSKEYLGKVELVRINADESGVLLRSLNVFSIPTMLVYQDGQLSGRFKGAMSSKQVQSIFEAASAKLTTPLQKMDNVNRIVGLIASVGVFLIAAYSGFSPILLTVSGLIFFYAIHDRCPVWQAFMGWIRKKTGNNP